MHLLDTGIVWALRGAKAGDADPGLTRWIAATPRSGLYLSVLTLVELEAGATQLARKDKASGTAARRWIETQVTPAFAERILPVDAAVVQRSRALAYADTRDGLLAATVLEHGLTLVTRHTAAFRAGKIKTFDPRGYTPPAAPADDWRDASRGAGPLWLKSLFVRT